MESVGQGRHPRLVAAWLSVAVLLLVLPLLEPLAAQESSPADVGGV